MGVNPEPFSGLFVRETAKAGELQAAFQHSAKAKAGC
jgi:hypothetical protein